MSDKTSTLKKPIKNGKKFFLLYSAAFLEFVLLYVTFGL